MMNKLVLDLYRRAHVPSTAIDPSNNMPYETTQFSADRFAELIVRECSALITAENEKVDGNWQCKDGKHIVWKIEELFGVKL
jgi:hypothetical protein